MKISGNEQRASCASLVTFTFWIGHTFKVGDIYHNEDGNWLVVHVVSIATVMCIREGEVMEPYQQRVVDEKKELDDKLANLSLFLISETFINLDEAERERLRRQSVAMMHYSQILRDRIAAFV